GAVDGTMFQTLSTDIATLGLTGGLRARYPLHRLIIASARIDVGAERVRLGIHSSGVTFSDHGWGTMVSAAAALDLFAMSGRSFGIGMRVELGYARAQAISLSPRSNVSSDTLMLPMMDASLGKLDLSGPTFAASLVGQF